MKPKWEPEKRLLIKAVCKVLKVEDIISSPTFSLVNEYHTTDGEQVYHFDFYRLKSEEEALDFGVEDYFYSGNYCFWNGQKNSKPYS